MSGLHVSALSHAFDAQEVVKGVSVFVGPGEFVCLLGPSGCGKTTLLRVAAGLENLQKGEVHIGEQLVASGKSGFNLPPEKRGVGLMFQDYALFPHLTVAQNILFGVKVKSQQQSWMEKALSQMDLTAYAHVYPHTLSGGQQQRVALLRAIAPQPGVLFLDEPFSGLDVTRRAETREQTLALLKETGVATLMVTHDPEEAMYMADRILVMDQGRMIQDGTPDDIYFRPNSAFVTDLFGAVNRLNGRVSQGTVKTPLGLFEAPQLPDGQAVQVLIRPDGIRLAELGGTPARYAGDAPCEPASQPGTGFQVVSARSLGRASRIIIRLADCEPPDGLIEIRVPGTFLPKTGSLVCATVNPGDAHIFKTE
ncbi:MAG: ABC transporter ATP-binding protein [Rhodospirillales bacterium]|nr:ABC transporter ATP-binding protein [Rhodospirillales bacterium]